MKFLRHFALYLFIVTNFYYASGQNNINKPSIKVSGEVTKSLTLFAEDLAKMQHTTVRVKSRDGKEHDYTGVPVQEIFALAGVTTGKDLRGENLSKYVLVNAQMDCVFAC
jgi:hypothetical protein